MGFRKTKKGFRKRLKRTGATAQIIETEGWQSDGKKKRIWRGPFFCALFLRLLLLICSVSSKLWISVNTHFYITIYCISIVCDIIKWGFEKIFAHFDSMTLSLSSENRIS